MKYVRTKENIIVDLTKYDDVDIENNGDITFCDYHNYKDYYIKYENIVGIADTIEELCDDFALVIEDKIKFIGKDLKQAKFWANKETRKVFGVIYCFDKNGVFYTKTVAKMNVKGECEFYGIKVS